MRIDLHTHSRISDGTDAPGTLIHHAADAGLDVVALTDHDTLDGWDDATAAGHERGITVVGGVEISTIYSGAGVHLLGYLPDPSYEPLAVELERIRTHRAGRLSAIIDRLEALGVHIAHDEVLAVARHARSLGRPHVADALVARGYVPNRNEAFQKWLADGGPAYVPKYSPSTTDAIALVRRAGGVAVLAHPWGRSSRRVLIPAAIDELTRAGLAGLEVDHDDHGPQDRAELRAIAADLGLVVTGSSDHHGAGKVRHPLGMNTTEPDQYELLLGLAGHSTAKSSRDQTGHAGSGA